MSSKPNTEKEHHKDPVCNIVVSSDSRYHYRYADKHYYFCSEHCLHKFKEHPEQYLDKETSPSVEAHGELITYTCPMHPEIQLKAGKDEQFREWFRHSSKLFAKHQGFISRTLLKSTEGTDRYAAVVEHESKETFMAMHLSDERQMLFKKVETLIEGMPEPDFYEVALPA